MTLEKVPNSPSMEMRLLAMTFKSESTGMLEFLGPDLCKSLMSPLKDEVRRILVLNWRSSWQSHYGDFILPITYRAQLSRSNWPYRESGYQCVL